MSSQVQEQKVPHAVVDSVHDALRQSIEHAARYLPAQGPIEVFVHHNTLHAFEDMSFDEGVRAGGSLFGCNPYLPESLYRREFEKGRIRLSDIEAVLQNEQRDDADASVAGLDSRYEIRKVMLQHALPTGDTAELQWVMAETDALRKFFSKVQPAVRDQTISDSLARLSRAGQDTDESSREVPPSVWEEFDKRSSPDAWTKQARESFVLTHLWQVCRDGAQHSDKVEERHTGQTQRHRDLLFEAGGEDSDSLVNEVLVRLCSAFLDQGFAASNLPERANGLYASFLSLYGQGKLSPTGWLRQLRDEVTRLTTQEIDPLQSIEESLRLLGVGHSERSHFITPTLLALRGWAGIVWQMETNAAWMPTPAPRGSLVEFLAVRLVLDRLSLAHVARMTLGFDGTLSELRSTCCTQIEAELDSGTGEQLAFDLFRLAQLRGWLPFDLQALSRDKWLELVGEVKAFDDLQRRQMFHLAYERKYRNETLDAVIAHAKWQQDEKPKQNEDTRPKAVPAFQVACCIDDREESFRRHLEECDPECETIGIAGFFGVAMYYRGSTDAHYTPLCPVSVTPQHYITEAPLYSALQADQRRSKVRRRIGEVTHQTHRGTRTFLGGLLTGVFGSIAAFPLVTRILFPRTTAKIRSAFGSMVRTAGTELRLERYGTEAATTETATTETATTEAEAATTEDHDVTVAAAPEQLFGYSVEEMANIVEGGLRAMGLADGESIARLFVVCGHGSSSMNNPHEAAHDCGACGGGRGGPNARAFAQMANDLRVRPMLAERRLVIPTDSVFVGCYHNTCDDSLVWYDLDRLPLNERPLFERAKRQMEQARKRSAHERCRRFESAGLEVSDADALLHVEGRAEDLSQTRPEYGHATNALCFVGRRDWSRDLFLDRRAFLTSYDPAQDDERSSILEQMLRAVIPVCAGINLEYYFSNVDPTGYGCGTKLPHNITSLLGVMDGAFSDLRPGLPWQMVEIHEPVRLLFVIETSPASMQRIIDDNPPISQLVNGDWVQLAVFDPGNQQMHRYESGAFVRYAAQSSQLRRVASSTQWYHGKRDHLGFATISSGPISTGLTSTRPTTEASR